MTIPVVALAGGAPANDNFAQAQVLDGATGAVSGTNVMATTEPGESGPHGSSVWYRWTAPADGDVEFNNIGSTFDTVLYAYTGDDVGQLTELAYNDDYYGLQSSVTFSAISGQTYLISQCGYSGNQGNFTLNWLSQIDPPARDAFEPDDSRFDAPLVRANGDKARHSIYPKGDADWVKFPVKAGHIYSARMIGLMGERFRGGRIAFFDEDGQVISWGDSFIAEEDGYAYLEASAYYYSARNCWYDLSLIEELPATISGTVVADDTQAPLEGVEVQLIQRYTDAYEGGGGWWDWTTSLNTDASGAYGFKGLAPSSGAYRLQFSTFGQGGEYVDEYYDDAVRFDAGTDVLLEGGEAYVADAGLARAGRIGGTVTADDNGEPLANVGVYVAQYLADSGIPADASGYTGGFYGNTDSEGAFSIGGLDPAGVYAVRFSDELSSYADEWYDDVATSEDAVELGVSAGQTTRVDASLALKPEMGHVRGRVEDRATGLPIQDIRVTYVTGEEGTSSYASGYLGWTNENGEYRRGDLDPSRAYTIRFTDYQSGYLTQYFDDKADAASADQAVLTPGAWFRANATLDLDPSKASVTGVVRDAVTGDPIPYVWVHTHASGYASGYSSGYDWGWHEAQTDAQGRYTLRGLAPSAKYALHAGIWFDEVDGYLDEYWDNKRDLSTADLLVFSAGESRRIDFDMDRPASLSGLVTEDGTGKSAKGVQVEVYAPYNYASGYDTLSGYRLVGETRADASGAYKLSWLAPGIPYRLAFMDNEKGIWVSEFYDDVTDWDAASDLILSSGENTVDAQLTRRSDIGAISGTVTDAYAHTGAPFVQVDLYYIDSTSGYSSGYWARTHTKGNGSFVFDGLPNRFTYKIKFSDPYGGPRYADEYYNGKVDFRSADEFVFDESHSSFMTNANLIPLAGEDDAPLLSDDAKSSYDDSATVRLTASDAGSGLKALYYTVDGGDQTTDEDGDATVSTQQLGSHSITYWAEDNVGNVAGPVNLEFAVVDATAPTADASVAPVANSNGWRSVPATVTLSATDSGSGVSEIKFRIGEGDDTIYSGPFAVAEGVVSVTFWATDNAGNASVPQVVEVKSDSTVPEADASVEPAANADAWRSAPATVSLTATDEGSRVDVIKFRIGSGVDTTYTGPFAVTEGTTSITYWAIDYADNASGPKTLEVKSDGTAPTSMLSYAKKSGDWTSSPALVSIEAADDGSGVAGTDYTVNGGVSYAFAGPFSVGTNPGSAEKIPVGFSSTDKVNNKEATLTVSVWVDAARPTAPTDLNYSGITTSTLRLTWAASTDVGAGVVAYEIYKNGAYLSTVTDTSLVVAGLVPGTSNGFRVIAIDGVGNRSALSAVKTISMPMVSGSVDVPATGAVSAAVNVGGIGDVRLSFENVTAPGVVTVTLTGNPPAGADAGFRFMGLHFDVDFSGTLSSGSSITITLPYDPAIPDARARNLKIKHWTNNGWVSITPSSVNTAAHTLTFTVTSLSPFALAESSAVNLGTKLAAGFGTATNTKSELIVGYGKSATLVGKLIDAGGTGMAGKSVVVEYWNSSLKRWIRFGDAAPSSAVGEYRLSVKRSVRTTYRMRFAGDAYSTASNSTNRTVYPKAYVGTPKAPKAMSRSKYYTVYGYLKPRHTSGTYPVRIYKYRWVSGKWKSYGYVKAKATNYTSSSGAKYSKYSRKIRLSSKGTWKLKAYVLKDGSHAGAWSSSYDKAYVK